MKLELERRSQQEPPTIKVDGGRSEVMITPPIDEDYWAYRVKLTDKQAVLGFPKFMTIGIGFAQEEDWNTNLPFTSPLSVIFNHIRKNKGDDAIEDSDVLRAIQLIRLAASEDTGQPLIASKAETLEEFINERH